MENNKYVECPALIRANLQTFSGEKPSATEQKWLKDIGMDRFIDAKRMYAIVFTNKDNKKEIQYSLQNPLTLKIYKQLDALIVNYCLENKDLKDK